MFKKLLLITAIIFLQINHLWAQTEMADTLRTNGKIYVVVMVIATIFAGIFCYLILLDRRITKLEKEKK